MAVLNDLDHKLLEHFRGYVVKKDFDVVNQIHTTQLSRFS